MNPKRPGRPPNPDGEKRKAWQVYCTEKEVNYIRDWLRKGGLKRKPKGSE